MEIVKGIGNDVTPRVYLSIEEAAELLGISKKTMYDYSSRKIFEKRRIGRCIYFLKNDVDEYFEKQIIPAINNSAKRIMQ